jgi:hypothetical protein
MAARKPPTRPSLIERQDDLRVFEGDPPHYKLAALALVTLRKIAVAGGASGALFWVIKYLPWHVH